MAGPARRVPDGMLQVGRIGRPYGVRGEVWVDLSTDRTSRLDPDSVLTTTTGELVVVEARPANGRWRVSFAGIDDRNAAERLTGQDLFAEPLEDPDALWVHELVGSLVVEIDGTERGRCTGVLANPAHDLLELDSGYLVPIPFVLSSDDGRTVIDPPAGLFDL